MSNQFCPAESEDTFCSATIHLSLHQACLSVCDCDVETGDSPRHYCWHSSYVRGLLYDVLSANNPLSRRNRRFVEIEEIKTIEIKAGSGVEAYSTDRTPKPGPKARPPSVVSEVLLQTRQGEDGRRPTSIHSRGGIGRGRLGVTFP